MQRIDSKRDMARKLLLVISLVKERRQDLYHTGVYEGEAMLVNSSIRWLPGIDRGDDPQHSL